MANWKIGSRGGTCARCAREFTDGERHASTLAVTGEAQLLREDLCGDCWSPEGLEAPGEPFASEGPQGSIPTGAEVDEGDVSASEVAEGSSSAESPAESVAESVESDPGGSVPESPGSPEPGPVFWWYTRYQAETKKKTLQLDLAALEQIFVSLEGREEIPVRELRYLLCLILMRKRRVKLQKLERSPEGESFLVKRPRREQLFRVFVFDFSPERIAELRTQLQALFDGADLEAGLAAGSQEEAGEGDEGAEAVPEEGAASPEPADAEVPVEGADGAAEEAAGGSAAGATDGDAEQALVETAPTREA